jgi:hypothetical protein
MTPWSGVPKPEERITRRTIRIERHGQTWSGAYTVEGSKLYVESAYGSRTIPLGRPTDDLNAKAGRVLEVIVDSRRARLAQPGS